MFGVTVNHFRKAEHPLSVQQSTKFALSLLKNCVEITTIILVDSSQNYDEDLDSFCQSIGVIYRHYNRILSFAEAYNYGAACLDEDWIVTMASDIYVKTQTFTLFKKFIEDHPQLPIGCLIPYLSSSDYVVQEATSSSMQHSCYSGIMTYNLNVFPRSVFREIDGLSDKYSGNFNDIETSIQLKKMGLKIILVKNFVHHYGRLTLQYGSNTHAELDQAQLKQDYPEFVGNTGLYQVRLDKFLQHPILKLVFRASVGFRPRRIQGKMERWVYQKLPAFQRINH